jgi:hypothetical protein
MAYRPLCGGDRLALATPALNQNVSFVDLFIELLVKSSKKLHHFIVLVCALYLQDIFGMRRK